MISPAPRCGGVIMRLDAHLHPLDRLAEDGMAVFIRDQTATRARELLPHK